MTVDWLIGLMVVGALAGLTGSDGVSLMWYTVTAAVVAAQTSLAMLRAGDHAGQTLGKQLLAIRVRDVDGGPLPPGRVVLREVLLKCFALVYAAIILADGALGIVAVAWYVWPLIDRRRVAPHDLICRTVVVRAHHDDEPLPPRRISS